MVSPAHLFLAPSHHLWVPPQTETYLSPIPQLSLQQTVQGERDDVVQVLNLEKAQSPHTPPWVTVCPDPRGSGTGKHQETKDSAGGQGGRGEEDEKVEG